MFAPSLSAKSEAGRISVRNSQSRLSVYQQSPYHAKNDQHAHAMSLLKKQRSQSAGLGPLSYAPIAQAFSKLWDVAREQLRVKFDNHNAFLAMVVALFTG